MDVVSISFNMKVRCVFSLDHLIEAILMSTHNIPFLVYICKKCTLNYSKSAAMGVFPRDSRISSK